jgi:phosphoribosylanthranilate isomerase
MRPVPVLPATKEVLVKICGLCDAESAIAAAEAGADLLGFHFCDSARRITPDEAATIIQQLPDGPALVGVFIDSPPREVDEVADYLGLDMVQLHGSERPPFDVEAVVMKALKVRDGRLPPDADSWPDPILLDSWSADSRGGTGRAWDWRLAESLTVTRKVFIAGGLNPGNVGEVVRRLRPYGVDVSSGVESAPRVKDPKLIEAFIDAAKGATGAA